MSTLITRMLTIAGGLLAFTPAHAQVFNGVVHIPEPATWTIFAVGLVGVALAARRNRRK